MKRLIAGFAIATAIALLLGTVAAWDRYLRAPAMEANPLPAQLTSILSTAGQTLLAQSEASADYESLAANFVPQSRRSFCGVASAVVTLNAVRNTGPRLTQSTLFAQAPVGRTDWLKVSFVGMSLREFAELLRAHGAMVTVVYASDASVEDFRRIVRDNLSTSGDFLLVNYQRKHIGQAESGHISPIAAYHADTDQVLILDVAAHKYPPVWVAVETLWDAMSAPLNSDTDRTRGFAIVHAGARPWPAIPGAATRKYRD